MSELRQLHWPPEVFVDREPALRAIWERFDRAREAGRPAYVSVHGAAGVGLRSLVQKSFWDLPERFADGAIRVRLGDAVQREPELLCEALGSVLVDVGVPASELPVSAEDRSRWLLTKTHSMSILLVLEDVVNAAQVEPFLLNSPRSAVVVISRSPILKLRQMGFTVVPVAPMDDKFGLDLFERMLGPQWCSAEDVRPETVVRACGGYPLAITTTAAQIAATPEWEVDDLLRQLSRRGLGALDPESQGFVRESFDRAYERLSPRAKRAYRLVAGLHPGLVVPLDAAAVVLDEPADARSVLLELASAHLLTRVAADRFEVHDIAHWHARDALENTDGFDQQRAAAERVLGWYLAQTARHDRALSDRPRIGPAYRDLDPGPTRSAALDWLERWRPNLRSAVFLAERFRLDDLAWQLCEALWGLYHVHGHYEDWITTHRIGVNAAERLGDTRVRMRMSSQLGAALLATGDLDQAQRQFTDSHEFARDCRDAQGRQSALEWLGKVSARRGDHAAALRWFDESWQVAEQDAAPSLRPRMFALLRLQRARVLTAMGDLDAAATEARVAADHFAETGESDNLAKSLLVLAKADPATAAESARQASVLFRADGSLRGEAAALEVLIALGEPGHRERLKEIYTALGDPRADQF